VVTDADLAERLSYATLRRLFSSHGLSPRKSLGQHFLIDEAVRRDIVAALELTADDQVLEIGPGPGNLTVRIAPVVNRVIAVEVDAGLAAVLAEQVSRWQNVEIRVADVLSCPLGEWLGNGGWKVAGNLPYYITSPVLFRLLALSPPPRLLVLMVQREVADRLLAAPGTPDYGLLTVSTAYHATVELVRTVSARHFWPEPEVSSAVVKLRPYRSPPFSVAPAWYARTARAAFGYRRKTLANALSHGLGQPRAKINEAIEAAGFDPDVRAEELPPAAFAALAASLAARGLV